MLAVGQLSPQSRVMGRLLTAARESGTESKPTSPLANIVWGTPGLSPRCLRRAWTYQDMVSTFL